MVGGFLVVGESVADIVRVPGRPDVVHAGGSPANVAYGLARLGRQAALLTQLGTEPVGELIGGHLRTAGVELLTDGQTGVPTPTAVVTLGPDGQPSYELDVRWTLADTEVPPPDHLHLGSVSAVLEPGSTAVLAITDRLRAAGATVSYDPNVRPALLGEPAGARARVERCVAAADLVKASDEDLAWLYPGQAAHEVAERWLALGPAVVLVTRGAAGSAAYTRYVAAEQSAAPAEVVDTVGAGDAFTAAVLDRLAARGLLGAAARPALAVLDQRELTHLLRYAGRAAALTVSRAGANPPTAAELGG
ncbi:carbohydrate kinase [Kitasatospora sp. NPDC096147]|uniref:carbohydrate kinase family protein n=1 Tax=Kitasatospora sp. NPDC096147 TaxID=3364093 RepID=UPI0037F4EE53